jgi:hypothetical protein
MQITLVGDLESLIILLPTPNARSSSPFTSSSTQILPTQHNLAIPMHIFMLCGSVALFLLSIARVSALSSSEVIRQPVSSPHQIRSLSNTPIPSLAQSMEPLLWPLFRMLLLELSSPRNGPSWRAVMRHYSLIFHWIAIRWVSLKSPNLTQELTFDVFL